MLRIAVGDAGSGIGAFLLKDFTKFVKMRALGAVILTVFHLMILDFELGPNTKLDLA